MDIRSPDWEYRYAALGKRPPAAFESFGIGELEGFDRAMQPCSAFPKLEKWVQDFRARIADPVIGVLLFAETAIPIAANQAQNTQETYRTLKSAVQETGMSLDEIPQDARNTLTWTKQRAKQWRAFDAEITRQYPTYVNFIVDELIPEIVNRQQACSIITLDDSAPLMRSATVRNEIYRAALKSETRSWLVNWDLATVAKQNLALSEYTAHQLRAYRETKDAEPELLPKDKRVGIYLNPTIGPLDTSLETLYEKLLPSQPAVEESTALNRAVTGYIAKRVKEIYA